jgi:CubicO group peptidase (beta-lactamase class C family)
MGLIERVDAVIDAALGSRIVGCVALIHQRGRPLYARAAGYADREAGTPVKQDTIFRLASVTKPIVAAATLRMIDLGLLSLDDSVTDYLPWFTPKAPDGTTPSIRIRHLLTHTSGLSYDHIPDDVSRGSDDRALVSLEENLRRLGRVPLVFPPGTAWRYGMSIDVLGGVLGAIEGDVSDLEGALRKHVLDLLGMRDTRFTPTDKSRLAHPYYDGGPVPLRMAEPQPTRNADGGVRVMSPGRIFRAEAAQSGGSGLCSTAGDFMRVLDAMQMDFLTPATRVAAFAVQAPGLPMDRPGEYFSFLGGVVTDVAASGWPKQGLVQWGGTWGNHWIHDPETETSLVVFTNTMWEGCNGRFRDQMRDAVYG